MKAAVMTLILSVAFLSAGAFAGNAPSKLQSFSSGFSAAYQGQN